jgi:hypothetical protein
VILALGRPRQKDLCFEASLGYIGRPHHKNKVQPRVNESVSSASGQAGSCSDGDSPVPACPTKRKLRLHTLTTSQGLVGCWRPSDDGDSPTFVPEGLRVQGRPRWSPHRDGPRCVQGLWEPRGRLTSAKGSGKV